MNYGEWIEKNETTGKVGGKVVKIGGKVNCVTLKEKCYGVKLMIKRNGR